MRKKIGWRSPNMISTCPGKHFQPIFSENFRIFSVIFRTSSETFVVGFDNFFVMKQCGR